MDHTEACEYCDKWNGAHCRVYMNMRLIRKYGCGHFPYRSLGKHGAREYVDGEIVSGKNRPGQQKQIKDDRKYHSKNDGKRKYKFNI